MGTSDWDDPLLLIGGYSLYAAYDPVKNRRPSRRPSSALLDLMPVEDQIKQRGTAVRYKRPGVKTRIDAPAGSRRSAPQLRGGALGRGGGSGGGGGGSAAGGAPAAPADPLSAFQMDEINAALQAITDRYEYQRTGLTNQVSGIERAFTLLRDQMSEEEEQDLFNSKAVAGGSGRINSGFFLQDQTRIADTYADQLVRARAEKNASLSPIQQSLGSINARRDAERAAEARRIAREMVGSKEAIAAALELV